jgi:AraC-like DNA-binding protein
MFTLLLATLVTVFISIILVFNNWRDNKNTLYLSLAFIFISIYVMNHYMLGYSGSVLGIAIFYDHFNPLFLLIGPCIFFYVRGTLRDHAVLTKLDLLHFLPAGLFMVSIMPWLFTPWSYKLEVAGEIIKDPNTVLLMRPNFLVTPTAAFIIRPLHLFFYLSLSFALILKPDDLQREGYVIPRQQENIIRAYIMVMLTTIFIMTLFLSMITFEIFETSLISARISTHMLHTAAAVAFGLLALSLLFFPQILYGMPRYKSQINNKMANQSPAEGNLSNTQSSAVFPSQEPFDELVIKIKDHLNEHRPFCKPDFSINDLSKQMGVPLNHLKYCINQVMQTKFTELRMLYRVNHAKNLMVNGTHNTFTIDAIAEMSGFNSRSSFYIAFKQVTNMTPSEFLDRMNAPD